MNKLIQWAIVALALLGALLVTSLDAHIRVVAFSLWIIADVYWVIHNLRIKQIPLASQFFAFLVLAIIGVIVNL